MSTFKDFSLPEMYETIWSSDILPDIDRSIDWESMKPMIRSLFHNDTEKGGRPNFDEIVMIKTLFLLYLYSNVDEKLEKELYDRISFHIFLQYPNKMPDARKLWALRERMSRIDMDKHIWSELWKQLESMGIVIRKEVIKDTPLITSDHGKYGRKKPPALDMPDLSEKQIPVDRKEVKRQARRAREEKKRLRKDERRESMTKDPGTDCSRRRM